MFVRRENFQEFTHYYPVVTGIVAINTLLFLASFFPSLYQYIYGFGVGSNLHVAAGEIWRLFTPVFLHGSFSHFLFNNFSLVIFAPALEKLLGKWQFLAVYLMAGLVGNIGTFMAAGQNYTHLGASGALYGLFGLYLYMILKRQDLIDPHSSQIIKMVLIIGVVYSLIMSHINYYAHLFGFLAGFAAGIILLKKPAKTSQKPEPPRFKARKIDDNVFAFEPKRHQLEEHKNLIIGIAVLLVILLIYYLLF